MQIVNGYMCATSCDVAAAKTGHDPKNPHDDPVKAAAIAEQKALASGKPVEVSGASGTMAAPFTAEAVRYGGSLSGRNAAGNILSATNNPLVDRLA